MEGRRERGKRTEGDREETSEKVNVRNRTERRDEMSSLDDRRVALQGGGHLHLHLQHPPPPYTASYSLVR